MNIAKIIRNRRKKEIEEHPNYCERCFTALVEFADRLMKDGYTLEEVEKILGYDKLYEID